MNKNILLVCVISFVLFSCGDDSDNDPTNLLLTYNAAVPTSEDRFFILTDPEGEFIDSMNVLGLNSFQFFGDNDIDRFTLTEIRTDDMGTLIRAVSYFDINASLFNDLTGTNSSFDRVSYTPQIDQSIGQILIASSIFSRSGMPSNFPDNFDFIEGDFIYTSIPDFNTPKFAIYENLEPGGTLEINLEDFNDLQLQPVEFSPDIEDLELTALIANNTGSLGNSFNYLLDLISFINTSNTMSFYEGIFTPGDIFSVYFTTFRYRVNGLRGSSSFIGELPAVLDPLEIEYTITENINSYAITAQGNFDRVATFWSNFENAPEISLSWFVNGSADSQYPMDGIASIIMAKYPEFDLTQLDYQQTEFVENSDFSYDDLIRDLLDNEFFARTNMTEIRSLIIDG